MKLLDKDDFMKEIYPKMMQKKRFGLLSHQSVIQTMNELTPKLNILNVRLDIHQYIRGLKSHQRDLWKAEARVQDIALIITKNAIAETVDPIF